METIFSTSVIPKPVGPYSLYKIVGSTIYLSGQIGIDGSTGFLVEGGIKEQTTQICRNLKAILFELGLGLKDVVKTTVFLKNMDDFSDMNEVYKDYFILKPARSTVEVSKLPHVKNPLSEKIQETLVEIECIAYNSGESISRNQWGKGRSI